MLLHARLPRLGTITDPLDVAPVHCRKTEWKRLPEIVRRFDIRTTTTTIGSALGGLIYVVVPANQKLGRLDIQVSGKGCHNTVAS